MLDKIKIHVLVGTVAVLVCWYYLVDSLPRSRLIPEYLTRVTAAADQAAVNGTLLSLNVEQPGFYLDNPVVSTRAVENGYEIVFAQTSKRRCEQIVSNPAVRQRATRVTIGGGECGPLNEVVLGMPAPGNAKN